MGFQLKSQVKLTTSWQNVITGLVYIVHKHFVGLFFVSLLHIFLMYAFIMILDYRVTDYSFFTLYSVSKYNW